MLQSTINGLWRNENIVNDLDYAIGSNTIFDSHRSETVDFNANETPITSNIDTQRLILK